MINKKNWVLGGLAFTAFLDGSVGQYLDPGAPFPVSSIPLMLIAVTLSFMWYYIDSEQIEYRRGKFLNIGIIALGIIAFPYYFFRSRGFRRGLIFTVLFIAVVIAWSALQTFGVYMVYYGIQH